MKQLGFFDAAPGSGEIITDIFEYKPGFFTPEQSALYLQSFIHDIHWQQTSIMMYGKEMITPRLTAWYGEQTGKSSAHPWTTDLLQIKERVEKEAGVAFQYVLLNYYRDGNDSVAWHDDMDRVPGKNKMVASISFGQERYFDIRHKNDHTNKTNVLLENGSYILMKGNFQQDWQHRIAKSTKVMKPRINLTFRQMM